MHLAAGVATLLIPALLALQDRPVVELTYLANMGVALEAGGRRVVIDGFHHAELRGTPAVPPEILTELERSTGRFRRIDLALTTHRHLDHFAAASVLSRLRSDTSLHYLAPAEIVDTLRARSGGPLGANVHPLRPPARGRTELDLAGIKVTVLDLPHGRTRPPQAQNLGYLIRLGGLTILHVGDADDAAARFAPHRLPAERIDVAVIPAWYLTEEPETVRRYIAARTLVVSHIWLGDSTRVRREVEQNWPGAIVLIRPGERFRISP